METSGIWRLQGGDAATKIISFVIVNFKKFDIIHIWISFMHDVNNAKAEFVDDGLDGSKHAQICMSSALYGI